MSTFGALTVTRASTKNVLGSNGLYQSVANNVPAFEFNADGSYRGTLVEPAATNLALRSAEFNDAAWVATRSSISANATTAPNGTTTADKLIASVDNNTHFILQSNIVVTAQIYNASIFAKKAEYDTLRLRMVNLWSPTPTAVFNLTSKTVVSTTSATARITEYPDGWFRLDMTATINAIAGSNAQLEVLVGDNSVTSFTGDGTSGIYIWGAQLEAGSVATSYIPTTGSTASRAADVISLTSASSLIGQDAGWVAIAFESRLEAGVARAICRLTNDSTATVLDGVLLAKSSTDQIQFILRTNNAEIGRRESATNQSGIFGVVIRYNEAGDTSLHVNGTRISTVLSTAFTFANSIPVISLGNTQNGANQLNGHLRAYAQGTSAISEAQANSLSTSIAS